MRLDMLADPALPTLASLRAGDLARITGVPGTRMLRLRYQPGARAILHVALGAQDGAPEGAIWLFAGDKAQKLARREAGARYDPPSGALFQAFPQDHRLPALAQFLDRAAELAPSLIGGAASGPPRLMRYRPGLSATFALTRQDGRLFFVKQTPDQDIAALALAAAQLSHALSGTVLATAPVAGILPELGLIAYEGARGRPLDEALQTATRDQVPRALSQVVAALGVLWSQSIVPQRLLARGDHLRRGEQAHRLVALADPLAGRLAAAHLTRLAAVQAPVRLRPIHADMKLEHAFLSGPLTTLIDTESLSLGDPDYDLAKLEARLDMAVALGQLSQTHADLGTAELRRHAGPHYDWFLSCARLQCARFFAQRMDPATLPAMRHMLRPC